MKKYPRNTKNRILISLVGLVALGLAVIINEKVGKYYKETCESQ